MLAASMWTDQTPHTHFDPSRDCHFGAYRVLLVVLLGGCSGTIETPWIGCPGLHSKYEYAGEEARLAKPLLALAACSTRELGCTWLRRWGAWTQTVCCRRVLEFIIEIIETRTEYWRAQTTNVVYVKSYLYKLCSIANDLRMHHRKACGATQQY